MYCLIASYLIACQSTAVPPAKELTDPAERYAAVRVGERFIGGEATDLNERIHTLATPGKRTVYYLWSTFCAPCLKTVPVLIEKKERYTEAGIDLIFLSLDPVQAEWTNYWVENSYPSRDTYWANADSSSLAWHALYPFGDKFITALPQYVVVGADRKIEYKSSNGQAVREYLKL